MLIAQYCRLLLKVHDYFILVGGPKPDQLLALLQFENFPDPKSYVPIIDTAMGSWGSLPKCKGLYLRVLVAA